MSRRTSALEHLYIQLAILCFFIVAFIPLLGITLDHSVMQTISLVIVVTVLGLFLITRLQRNLGDNRLQLLGYLWIAKLLLTVFLLYFLWMPELSRYNPLEGGFDPLRYYFQSQELVEQNWDSALISLEYPGILYYFGGLFYVFGHNPINPAFLNAFTTLLATLLLVRVGYEINAHRAARGWMLGLAMILPEVLFYDIMTSRESILMALLTVMLLQVGKYIGKINKDSLLGVLVVAGCSLLGIAAIRTSILVSIIIAIVLLDFLLRPLRKRRLFGMFLLGLLVAAVIALPIFVGGLGFENLSYNRYFSNVFGEHEQLLLDIEWKKNSISQIFLPHNSVQAVIFVVPRLLLYLVAPIPTIQFDFSSLLAGNFGAWLMLMVTISAALYIFFIPWAVASLVYSFRERQVRWKELVFHIPYWVLIISIAGGNQIVHERYRIMATILFWGCVWLGLTSCPKKLIRKVAIGWYLMLTVAGIGALLYKITAVRL